MELDYGLDVTQTERYHNDTVPCASFTGCDPDVYGQTLEADWQPSVSLQDITFAYPTRSDVTVLDNFSLNIEAGTTTALVGASGSGKSTVMQLLLRYYDPSQGQIMLGGKEIESIPTAYVRSLFGYVGQEPALFNLSIKQNILLGVDDPVKVTMDQVEQECKLAYCHDFILQLPEGYNAVVEATHCHCPSHLKNPKILLLDEATSALDTQSERLVQHALEVASKGRTTIVIAHRLSTLVEAQGVYHDLVKKQEIAIASSASQSDATQIIATGVIGVVLAFIFSWQVTLVVLAVAPFLVFGSMFRSKIEESYGSDNKKATEQCGQVAAEAIKEIRTVAALNQQSFFETRD
ncbi:P-loop containing nucleoside triphosphate hydrolase protein [Hesseltinella vesiculosa]|uniref:P-loop containing nucleoside triphosphate hydrolase protein n=1 Tax=Hesseltinella vesiculosa TaxID=101127 RepID=A0A1X2GQV2_9FUNG|nr:P-loop containing nucleoside triphosphate hydrolase protein [Hesseltinella vesiculosa]